MQGIKASSLDEKLRAHMSLGATKLHAATTEPRCSGARGPQIDRNLHITTKTQGNQIHFFFLIFKEYGDSY